MPSTATYADPGQCAGDLPHLGVDEQKRREQQQQRQRPDDDVEQQRRAATRPLPRPTAAAASRRSWSPPTGRPSTAMASMTVCESRRPTVRRPSTAPPARSMNTASSAGPTRRGRSSARRPRNRLATTQVTTSTATTKRRDGEVLPTLQSLEVQRVEPEQRGRRRPAAAGPGPRSAPAILAFDEVREPRPTNQRSIVVECVTSPRRHGRTYRARSIGVGRPGRPVSMGRMARILVTEEIAEGGLDRLRAAGHEVDVRIGLVAGRAARGHRGAPGADHPLGDAGDRRGARGRLRPRRRRPGRHRARQRRRRRGHPPRVMVVNAPQSNIISAAEHTMALLLAQARNVPQAHAALVAGRWERSRWEGVELGRQDARHRRSRPHRQARRRSGARASACGSSPTTRSCPPTGPARSVSSCCRSTSSSPRPTSSRSTFPKTPETTGLISRDLLLKAKPTLRLINVARGGIVDEAALADASATGVIAGAALDVFDTEPTTESPLFGLDVGRRHAAPRRQHPRGAGQGGRHDRRHGPARAGRRVRAVRRERRRGRGQRDAAPVPAAGRAAGPAVRLARRRAAATVEISVEGDIGGYDTRIVGLAVLKGFFGRISDEPVTYVNAPQRARESRHRGPRGQLDALGRLRQPRHRRRAAGTR